MEVTGRQTHVPHKLIFVGEFAALLVTVTVPDTLPVSDGAKATGRVAVCPGLRTLPDMPVALKPGPETLMLEMVTLELPELVKVTFKELRLPTMTLPKFKFDVLALSCADVVDGANLAVGAELALAQPCIRRTIPAMNSTKFTRFIAAPLFVSVSTLRAREVRRSLADFSGTEYNPVPRAREIACHHASSHVVISPRLKAEKGAKDYAV